MLGSLNQYLIRVTIFLVLILIIVVFLYPVLQTAFVSNVYINVIIILALVIGLVFNVYNLSKLNNDYSTLANFNIHKTPQVFLNSSSILKSIDSFELWKKGGCKIAAGKTISFWVGIK